MKFLIFTAFLALSLAQDQQAEDAIKEQVKGQAVEALQEARSDTDKARICTCKELDQCIDQARKQASECFDPCYEEFAKLKLLDKPEVLKECIKDKEKLLDQVLPCVTDNLHAWVIRDIIKANQRTFEFKCSDQKIDKKVPTIDVDTFISKIEEDVDRRAQIFLRAIKSKDMNKVATAAKAHFMCFKNCFVNVKNPHGFCHEQMGCMPYITDSAANKTIETCGAKINWTKELNSVCSCAEKAGMGVLHDFCDLLNEFTQ